MVAGRKYGAGLSGTATEASKVNMKLVAMTKYPNASDELWRSILIKRVAVYLANRFYETRAQSRFISQKHETYPIVSGLRLA